MVSDMALLLLLNSQPIVCDHDAILEILYFLLEVDYMSFLGVLVSFLPENLSSFLRSFE